MSELRLTGPSGTVFEMPEHILGRISLSEIELAVCERFKLKRRDIEGPLKKYKFARPRMLAMALSREMTRNSFPAIGLRYGGRDHTTVLHACNRIAELRRIFPEWEEHYQAVKLAIERTPANENEEQP